MRSSAAPIFRAFVALCLLSALPGRVFADTIYLKSGRKITATHVVTEDGQVSYDTPAGRFSFPLSIVDHVVHEQTMPGPNGDHAASLPMAPPPDLAAPTKGTSASDAVHDGSID